jgi:hypothetical protein
MIIPTAMSHEGEFSSQLIQAVELLTKSFRSNLTTNGTLFPDGVSAPRRTGEFRTNLKDALMHLHIIRRYRKNPDLLRPKYPVRMTAEDFANNSAGWDRV